MDRYRRLYWHFPSLRGVMVESLESSVSPFTSAPTDLRLDLEDPAISVPKQSSSQPSQLHPSQPESKPEQSKPDQYLPDQTNPNQHKYDQFRSDQYKSDKYAPSPVHNKLELKSEKMDTEPTDYSTPVPFKPETEKLKLARLCPKFESSNSPGSAVTTGPCNTPPVLGKDIANSMRGFSSQSVASWLNSAIDNVFGASDASPSVNRTSSAADLASSAVDSPSLASSRVDSSSTLDQLPCQSSGRTQLQLHTLPSTSQSLSQSTNPISLCQPTNSNEDEAWFDLNRSVSLHPSPLICSLSLSLHFFHVYFSRTLTVFIPIGLILGSRSMRSCGCSALICVHSIYIVMSY